MIKWLLIGLIALGVLGVGALLAVPLLLDSPAMQAYVQQQASHALGRPVKFGGLSIAALPLPSVRLRQLQVAEDPAFGPGPFVTVNEGRMRIRLRPLLQGRVELADLTLDEPRIRVIEDAAGRLNVATLGPSGPPGPSAPPRVGGGRPGPAGSGAVLLSRVRIANGAVEYEKIEGPGKKTTSLALDRINVTVTQGAVGEPLRVSGDARGPGDLKLTIAEGSVSLGPGRAVGDAQVKATVDVEGRDVRAVVGTLVPVLYAPPQLESQQVQTKVAKGTVTFRLVVALGPPRVSTLRDIQVKGVQLEPVLVDYLCQHNAVTGPLDLTGEMSLRLPEELPTLAGSGRLLIGAGRVVGPDLLKAVGQALALTDLVGSTLTPGGRGGSGAKSPLSFDSITATYTISNGVVRTDDLVYVARDVRVTGAGTYGLVDGRTAMDVTVSQGTNRLKARVAGSPGALSIVPTDVRLKEPKDLRKAIDRLLR